MQISYKKEEIITAVQCPLLLASLQWPEPSEAVPSSEREAGHH